MENMNISENKDNIVIKSDNYKVKDVYLHKPTGLKVMIEVVLRDIILCKVCSGNKKIATYCTSISNSFDGLEWEYLGNFDIKSRKREGPMSYWTEMNQKSR